LLPLFGRKTAPSIKADRRFVEDLWKRAHKKHGVLELEKGSKVDIDLRMAAIAALTELEKITVASEQDVPDHAYRLFTYGLDMVAGSMGAL
jgi:hypothetical protein